MKASRAHWLYLLSGLLFSLATGDYLSGVFAILGVVIVEFSLIGRSTEDKEFLVVLWIFLVVPVVFVSLVLSEAFLFHVPGIRILGLIATYVVSTLVAVVVATRPEYLLERINSWTGFLRQGR